MKQKFIAVFLLGVLMATALSAADTFTGRQIAQKMKAANFSNKGLILKGGLKLMDLKNKKTEQRNFTMLSRKVKGLSRTLFRFTDSTYKGTTFLTIEERNDRTIQYLYMNSIGSPRQVQSSDKEAEFLDTDFSNEDLGGVTLADYTYKRLADRKIGNKEFYVIESFPKNKKSKYSRKVIMIDKHNFIPVNVKCYNKQKRLVKIIKSSHIKKIGGDMYIPFSITATDLRSRHKTEMRVSEAREADINRGLFNKMRMSRPWPY